MSEENKDKNLAPDTQGSGQKNSNLEENALVGGEALQVSAASESKTAQSNSASPGHLLREARIAKDMSVEELTGHTMLSRATVVALEENDFGRLSQPVFVRGYYRKCAKVLGMPEDEIMQAYSKMTGVDGPKPASPRQVDVMPQDVTPGGGGKRTLGLILAIAAGAALLAVIWMLLPSLQSLPAGDETASEITGDVEVSRTSSGNVSRTAPTPVEEPASASAAASTQTTTSDADQSVVTNPETNADTKADITTQENTDAVITGEPNVPPGMHLIFDQRSWVDIRNADGKRMLGGIIEAGSKHTFPADGAPYDVRLGYARGIRLYVNGELFDLPAETDSENTARFYLKIP